MDCETIRTELHIEPAAAPVQAHLGHCQRCAAYAARFARLDRALRAELVVAAPAALTSAIQASVAAPTRLEAALREELHLAAPVALTARLLDLVPQPERVTSRVDVALRDTLVVQAPADLTARLQALVPQMAAAPVAAPAPAPSARPRRWVVTAVYFVTAALLLVSMFYAGQIYSTVIAQLGLQAWLAEIATLPAQLLEQLYTLLPQSRVVIGTLVRLQQPLQWLLAGLVLWAVVDMSQRQQQRARQYA